MGVYQDHKPENDGGLYIKLKDGDKIKGRIVSEPVISIYKEGDKPRYSWVMFVREFNGKSLNKPQILTKGISVYNGIADLVEDWGEPTEFDITIKRTGSGMNDTEYSLNPVKESRELTTAEHTEIEKVNLLQAVKGGKWLADYVKDGELPEPVVAGDAPSTKPKDVVIEDVGDEPINLDDVPF